MTIPPNSIIREIWHPQVHRLTADEHDHCAWCRLDHAIDCGTFEGYMCTCRPTPGNSRESEEHS